jgi:hypothetical protein
LNENVDSYYTLRGKKGEFKWIKKKYLFKKKFKSIFFRFIQLNINNLVKTIIKLNKIYKMKKKINEIIFKIYY